MTVIGESSKEPNRLTTSPLLTFCNVVPLGDDAGNVQPSTTFDDFDNHDGYGRHESAVKQKKSRTQTLKQSSQHFYNDFDKAADKVLSNQSKNDLF